MSRLAAAKSQNGEGESISTAHRPRIDKDAAARFVKHSLGPGSSSSAASKSKSNAEATEFLKQMSQSITSQKK